MKKNLLYGFFALSMAIVGLASCDPVDSDDHSLGAEPQENQLAFSATPTAGKANIVEFKNESTVEGVVLWDLGNGGTAKGESVKAQYPFKGEYTVAMTLYTTGGSATISKVISIADDDMALLDTPMYNALTGGAANLGGKTWVFDQYHDGHFGVGPAKGGGDYDGTPKWWSCPANGKLESSLYTQEFTFVQVGVKMIWKNNGKIYTNEAGKNDLGGAATVPGAGDFDVEYTPKESYTYTLDEINNTLTLSDGAFMGHYTGSSTYYIRSLTEDELYLEVVSNVESGNGWWYRFVPKEKNVKPEVAVKAVKLSEDFEADKLSVDFAREDMGELDFIYSNPAPVPVNTSKKVYLYEKSIGFYSNISYTAPDYKFDLTKANKVRMKVFVPSYNDYTTVADVAGDWIAVNQLQKQVAVKLQNSAAGGSAWETQTEIVKTNLTTDQWIELEFDFSEVKDRKDYDKIVIQFGAEGHAAPGIFFFDDFYFGE